MINNSCLSGKSQFVSWPRRRTRPVFVGDVQIGGGAPIVIQSMTKTDTRDVEKTIKQVRRLQEVGCEVVRLAIPDEEAARALKKIKNETAIPLIADIHFQPRLALVALESGVDGLRINPGTIGPLQKVREIVKEARRQRIPIRIGVNAGSLEKDLLAKYGEPTAEAMVASALHQIRRLEDMDFDLIKVSLKASDVWRTLSAYQLLAQEVDYPFHVGITEAGPLLRGTVKSSVGIALLLRQGLVDTLRVSLTSPPEEEVRVAKLILSAMKIRSWGPELISCPTCSRCEVDLLKVVKEIESWLENIDCRLTIAVMGCMVNGPGEAKDADLGVACGRGTGVIFKKGRILRKVKEAKIVDELKQEIKIMIGESGENNQQEGKGSEIR
ncbi:MAG: 4-hydroxy-3-methylbut-2-en-1-yl diphosphate synthase [Candidatus Aminicenantes bacterium 4484_214]|nr:MAG: 4-hydroxy-3-methylbut-2-en-1-yl diphosphate synthase [Candidatus Aminicenantes bacterium 4484_214]RLE06988.1 MAG: 4-hydroxy-3-methylbut-2-en-1-yl diphosphate synthase [Candidatus Aminicenantes bacterium]